MCICPKVQILIHFDYKKGWEFQAFKNLPHISVCGKKKKGVWKWVKRPFFQKYIFKIIWHMKPKFHHSILSYSLKLWTINVLGKLKMMKQNILNFCWFLDKWSWCKNRAEVTWIKCQWQTENGVTWVPIDFNTACCFYSITGIDLWLWGEFVLVPEKYLMLFSINVLKYS